MAAVITKGAALLAVPALLGALAGTAAAYPSAGAGPEFTPANVADATDCPAGFACFYTGPNFTGDKCQWQSASTDHTAACSWAGTTNVQSIHNNGTSSEFAGLCFYRFPNYDRTEPVRFIPQGGQSHLLQGGWKVLSHKWVRPGVGC